MADLFVYPSRLDQLMQNHICPICGYDGLAEDPGPSPRFWGSQEICACCGWQFGYNNPAQVERYRAEWVAAGANWFVSSRRPLHWNIDVQFPRIGLTIDDVLHGAKVAQERAFFAYHIS